MVSERHGIEPELVESLCNLFALELGVKESALCTGSQQPFHLQPKGLKRQYLELVTSVQEQRVLAGRPVLINDRLDPRISANTSCKASPLVYQSATLFPFHTHTLGNICARCASAPELVQMPIVPL